VFPADGPKVVGVPYRSCMRRGRAAVISVGVVLAGCAGATSSRLTTGGSQPTFPASTTAPPAPAGSGVYGFVTAGPTCPVERPDQPCPPRPVAAHIQAESAAGRTVAATDSDGAGRYLLALAPGSYTLVATTGTVFPRCPSVAVIVRAGGPSRTDIGCDTGIR